MNLTNVYIVSLIFGGLLQFGLGVCFYLYEHKIQITEHSKTVDLVIQDENGNHKMTQYNISMEQYYKYKIIKRKKEEN